MALIDLHCHTSRYSDDSRLAPEALLECLAATRIEGLAITEHNHCWSRDELDDLLERTGLTGRLKLWAGQEVHVVVDGRPLGDLLVFGPTQPIKEETPIERVLELIEETGGFAIAAHLGVPSRGLGSCAGDFPLAALEIWNCRYGHTGERLSLEAAIGIDLPHTGGSDAHSLRHVGLGATEFPGAIADYNTLHDLRAALERGDCQPWKPQNIDRFLTWWRRLSP